VTVSAAFSIAQNDFLRGPSGGCGPVNGVQTWATQFAMPFRFSASECGNHTTSMAFDLVDPKTLVLSNDFTSVRTQGEDGMDSSVTFSRAGVVSMSIDPSWIRSSTACGAVTTVSGQNLVDVWLDLYASDSVQAFGRVSYRQCSAAPAGSSTSFPVSAGQTVKFAFRMSNVVDYMTGSGAMGTIHFEPTP